MTGSDSQTTRWCMGLKSIGFREILPEETELLSGEANRMLLAFWQPTVVALASPAVLYLSYVVIGDGPEPPAPVLIPGLVLVLVGLLILPAVAFLRIKDVLS